MLLAALHGMMLILNGSETYGRLLERKNGKDKGALQSTECQKDHMYEHHSKCRTKCYGRFPCQSAACECHTVEGEKPMSIKQLAKSQVVERGDFSSSSSISRSKKDDEAAQLKEILKEKQLSLVVPEDGELDDAVLELPTCSTFANLKKECGDNGPVANPNAVNCNDNPCDDIDLPRCCKSYTCDTFDCGSFDRIDRPSGTKCQGFPKCGDLMIEHTITMENPTYERIARSLKKSWVTAKSIQDLNNNAQLARNQRIKIGRVDVELCCKVGNRDARGYNRGINVKCKLDKHCNPEGVAKEDHTNYCDPALRVCVPRFKMANQVSWKRLEDIFSDGMERIESETGEDGSIKGVRQNSFLPTLINDKHWQTGQHTFPGSRLYGFETFGEWVRDDHRRELESPEFFQRYMELAAGVPVDNFGQIAGKGDDAGEACVKTNTPSCFGPLYCGPHSDDLISLWYESDENDERFTGMSDEKFRDFRNGLRSVLTDEHDTVAKYFKATPAARADYGQCGKIRNEIKLPGGQHIAYEVNDRERPDLDPKFVNGRTSERITEDTTYEDDGKRAIIILGPSAAGKTASTFLMLKTLSIQNGWYKEGHNCKPLKFYSADGGLVREASSTYWRWKRAVQFECGLSQDCVGASDFYSGITKEYQKDFLNHRVIPYLIRRGKNIIFPTVARRGHAQAIMEKLKEEGYSVSIVMVYAPLAKTRKNAQGVEADGRVDLRSAREVDEGKKWGKMGYGPALANGWDVFKYARRHNIGWGNKFAVLDNSNYGLTTRQKMGLVDGAKEAGSIGKTWDAATKKVRLICNKPYCFYSQSINEVQILDRKNPIDIGDADLQSTNAREIEIMRNAQCAPDA